MANFFTESGAARYIGTSLATLRRLRIVGAGPAYYRPTPRIIRYRQSDLDLWLEARHSAGEAHPARCMAEVAL